MELKKLTCVDLQTKVVNVGILSTNLNRTNVFLPVCLHSSHNSLFEQLVLVKYNYVNSNAGLSICCKARVYLWFICIFLCEMCNSL